MLARLLSFGLQGIDAFGVDVEVDAAGGLPKTVLVGLPEQAVKESVHRIERALANLGFNRPRGRTVINLAPADTKKEAGAFDLPIAVGLLVATGQLPASALEGMALAGELALDGTVRPIKGALSIAMAAAARGVRSLLVPRENAREAAVVEGLTVVGVGGLGEAVAHLTGMMAISPTERSTAAPATEMNRYSIDFADVRGQEYAKRALVVAASGGHNILMIGPPKAWKQHGSTAPPGAFRRTSPSSRHALSVLLTTRFPMPGWWVGAIRRHPAKSAWPITGSCFWTNCLNSTAAALKSLGNRSRKARSPFPGRFGPPLFQRSL
jgi:magnesium chelatase family protein